MARAADDDSPPSRRPTVWRWAVVVATLLALASLTLRRPSADRHLPLPAATLGFAPCADGRLAASEQLLAYYRQLDAASPRLRLLDIGTTTEGRPHVVAVVSSERTMADLARYQVIARRLARAEDLDDTTARALARDGKAVVWVNFGLHSSEVAGPLAAAALLHRVVSDESAEMRAIRDNVILLLMPDMNPDGTTRWARWFDAQRGGPFARAPLPEPAHRYAGHDINRDWFMFTQRETRNVARQLYAEWFPQIVHDQHQAPPFPARIFIPPYADPVNPRVPAGVLRGIATLGDAMGRRLVAEGKPGAISRIQYDAWWNGGMRTAPMFHNMIGLLTEVAHPWPWSVTHDPASFPRTFGNGLSTTTPSATYPRPFTGGPWGLSQACDYMQTVSLAVLHEAAARRVDWQFGIYAMGRDAMRAGAHETHVVSADQWDPGAAAAMIDVLRLGGIDIARATAPFTISGRHGSTAQATYPAGSYVIRGGQAFSPFLADLLGAQHAPEDAAADAADLSRSYDLTGWTLPLQMGVVVDRLDGGVTVPVAAVTGRARVGGGVTGIGKAAYVLDTRANGSFTAANRLRAAGEHIARATRAFSADGRSWPAGTFIVSTSSPTSHRVVAETAAALDVTAVALDTPPLVHQSPLRALRAALYQPWGDNPDAGWTRWVLEQHEFPFEILHDEEVRRGGLPTRFDVIVLPDATPHEMRTGLAADRTPPRYAGGLGDAGVAALAAFVHGGGTLVTLGRAGGLPIEALPLGVRDLAGGMSRQHLHTPGVLLRIVPDATHPLSWGLPPLATAMVVEGPAYETLAATSGAPSTRTVAVRYASSDLVASGWMRGAPLMAGRAAVVEVEVGAGRVILIGVRAQHRGQSVGTFKLLFNALLRPNVPD